MENRNSCSNSDNNNFQAQSPTAKTSNKGGFFRVPAILFDRGIFPRCFGLSEDAFRQYIHECSYINKHSGMQFSNQRAAKNCLGFSEENYRAVKKELIKNHFVLRYYKKKEPDEKPAKKKTWGCSNPPLLKLDEVDRNSESWFFRPQCEPRISGGGAPSFLPEMSPEEIDVYMNLLWQNLEHWYGINPNYVRYELSSNRSPGNGSGNLAEYFYPKEAYGDRLLIDNVLVARCAKSKDEIEKILCSLVHRGLFKFQYWIGQYTAYEEKRREKNLKQLKLIHYLDDEQMGVTSHGVMKEIASIVRSNKRFKLIAQLRSCLELDPKFELVCDLNCVSRAFTKHIKNQKRTDYSEKKIVDAPASIKKQSDNLDKREDEMERRPRSRRQEAIEEVSEVIASDLVDDFEESTIRNVDLCRESGAGIDF